MARALIHLTPNVPRGQPMEVRALISHPMETGYRPGADGRVLARDIIRRFTCHFNGELVFAADLHPAISANPYLSFFVLADTGTLEFRWQGDHGFVHTETSVQVISG
ncbi:MAG: thiosulfate oxidation carrier complex protein SoxZ [Pseudomonadota bacterium]